MTTLITGGAGFIGTNLADRLIGEGEDVIVFDALSRPGSEDNLEWLRGKYGMSLSRFTFVGADVASPEAVQRAVDCADRVFHLAAQTAVTTSLEDPWGDFETNVMGTINVLEAIRRTGRKIPLVFTSTNKVYGELDGIEVFDKEGIYAPDPLRSTRLSAGLGVNERQPLQFSTPYGCSKGAADQYVVDYGKTFDLPTVTFRMSCIYGPHQNGTEDQGWVAHFAKAALAGEPVTVYGDGKQVRDLLYVEDLVDALLLASETEACYGRAFNIGGGPEFSASVSQVLDFYDIQAVTFEDWRPADQRWYVSDVSEFTRATNWVPFTPPHIGLDSLRGWLVDNMVRNLAALTRTPPHYYRTGAGEPTHIS